MDKDKLEKLKKESRKDAHNKVTERGSIHFRLDSEIMELLIDEANKVRVPFSVFARMLMIEGLVARKNQALTSGILPSKTTKRSA